MEEEITIWKKGDIIYGVGVSGLIKIYKVKKVISSFLIPGCVVLELDGLLISEKIQILIEDTKEHGSTYGDYYYASTAEKAYTVWDTVLKNIDYSYTSI